jgi:hypothetical protein
MQELISSFIQDSRRLLQLTLRQTPVSLIYRVSDGWEVTRVVGRPGLRGEDDVFELFSPGELCSGD